MSQISFDLVVTGGSRRRQPPLNDLGEDVRLAQHEQLLAVDLDLGAAVLAVEDLVPLGHIERDALLAILVPVAVADGDHLALLGLFLRGIGEDEAARGRLLLLDRLNDQPIATGLQLHPFATSVIAVFKSFPPRLALYTRECQDASRV